MHTLFKLKQALVALAMVLTPTLIYGQTQSGTLDATFGTGAKVPTTFPAVSPVRPLSPYSRTGKSSRRGLPKLSTAPTLRWLDITPMARWTGASAQVVK